MWLRTCALIFVVGCAQPSKVDIPSAIAAHAVDTAASANPALRAPLSPSLAKKAEQFDRFFQGRLPPEELEILKTECKTAPSENPFCQSFSRLAVLEKRLKKKTHLAAPTKPPQERPAKPASIVLKKGRIANASGLRKTAVPSLLKGLAGFSVDELKALVEPVQKMKGCPNNLAAALAATLEDHLPSSVGPGEIAGLYEEAADCLRHTEDFEHYLTRAGLLYFAKKDFAAAAGAFKRATRSNTQPARAFYWLYRSEKALGHEELAKAALTRLDQNFPLSFHALVAKSENNEDPALHWLGTESRTVLNTRSKRVTLVNPMIEQAEILASSHFDDSAAFMADWALDEGPRAELSVRLYMAALADGKTRIVYANDVVALKPKQIDRFVLELYFPSVFGSVFEKNSGSVDPWILMSVARQESIFDPRAISQANAQGLMQINPETAARLADGKPFDLFNPEDNVRIGARYLAELLKRFDGKIHWVLAAYNAGEEKLGEWKRRYPVEEPLLFVDLISYRETRNYVATVLRNYFWYRRLNGAGQTEFAKALVTPDVARK